MANNLKDFNKGDYIKKADMSAEHVKLFENKLNFDSSKMQVWPGYNPNLNNNEVNINFTNNEENANIISISYLTDFQFMPRHKYFIAIDLTLN